MLFAILIVLLKIARYLKNYPTNDQESDPILMRILAALKEMLKLQEKCYRYKGNFRG